ncbi:hypothetical protein MRB53_008777 [Persea americana]|uniref:Uncharacterized protein n=1 Tax=Persea americana TaxID=3435 RepID=A0ACC2LMA9_PERAE|nr:hypothetical protein MRB53_008777 [Persea americana]
MVVRIRLSRFGCKNRPFYRVMAADSRSPRDGKHLEVLGYYNPLPGQDGGKRMANDTYVLLVVYFLLCPLYFDWCCRYWLSVGAQPSEPVQRILFRSGLLPPPPMLAMACKGGPRDTRVVDPLGGRFVALKEPTVSDQPKGEGDEAKNETSS